MNWYVYMLLCNRKIFYVGISNNIQKRMSEHVRKLSFFTKKFSVIKFVYAEKYPNKYQAAKREKQIKGWRRAKKQLLINKLGYNTCTGLVEALMEQDENLVSLLRA